MQSSADGRNARLGEEPRRPSYDKVPTYFQIECLVCDRTLRVLVECLGQPIVCGHCGCRFVARDPTSRPSPVSSALEKMNPLRAASSRGQQA